MASDLIGEKEFRGFREDPSDEIYDYGSDEDDLLVPTPVPSSHKVERQVKRVCDFWAYLWQKQGTRRGITLTCFAIIIVIVAVMLVQSKINKYTGPRSAIPEKLLKERIAAFSPTELTASYANLAQGDKDAILDLIEASIVIHKIYMGQVWSGNIALKAELAKRVRAAEALGIKDSTFKYLQDFFDINVGPFDRLLNQETFIKGGNVPAVKPLGANFYPEDLTKAQFTAWKDSLAPQQKEMADSYFSVIRRDDGALKAVPYSVEYATEIAEVQTHLRAAARKCASATLGTYLTKRADALGSDDYYDSDVAWMAVDGDLDVTLGPYETYEDALVGLKAAFEAQVTVVDHAETAKVEDFNYYLQTLEDNLPEPAQYKRPDVHGDKGVIRVVHQVFSAGDARAGVQSTAFNLPNDERIVSTLGSKRVMLLNMQHAKFDKILTPIAARMMEASQIADVQFDAFFLHTVAHELSHGLGPQNITVGGKATTVRLALAEYYSSVEEAKADLLGLWSLGFLAANQDPDHHVMDPALLDAIYTTFVASGFRSMRFGTDEAHAQGVAIYINRLMQKGSVIRDATTQLFSVDLAKIAQDIEDVAREILLIEATGDYAAAKALVDKDGYMSDSIMQQLKKLSNEGVPVDIKPIYKMEDA